MAREQSREATQNLPNYPGGVENVLPSMEEAIIIAQDSISSSTKKLYKCSWDKYKLFATESGSAFSKNPTH